MTARAKREVASGEPRWRKQLREALLQEPLIASRPSLIALRQAGRECPGAVFLGIGLCTRAELSRAMPLDVLGMLLAAEVVRRSVGAACTVVLVADEHARANGLAAAAVASRTLETVQLLTQARAAAGLERMHIVTASQFHASAAYRAALAEVAAHAPRSTHEYVLRQVADVSFFDRAYRGIIKVGWSTDGGGGRAVGGEAFFDERCRKWVGSRVAFVYCKAGRVLDDRRRKAAPYLALEPSQRICLRRDEDVARKLGDAPITESTRAGVRNHLKTIVYSYGRLVQPLRGTLEERISELIEQVCSAPIERRAVVEARRSLEARRLVMSMAA